MGRTNSQGPWSRFGSGGGGGGLLQMCKHEQTRGVWGYALPRNFKFKSSEMALNASKPANSNIKL